MKSYKKILIGLVLVAILVLSTIATWLYSQVDSALPILEGKKTVFGLTNTATIQRDINGIATIQAKNRADIAVATGFIHAQERFFQMDLLRRNSAGELSSLFGKMALGYDKLIRRHRFRERARDIVNNLPSEQLTILKSYTRGVNQGLLYLNSAPFEYLLLQQKPVQWQEEDSILTIFSMYIDLQYHDGQRERSLGLIKAILSADVYNFLNPKGSLWDAAIDNTRYQSSPMPVHAWPSASSTSLLTPKDKAIAKSTIQHYQSDEFFGSNNWAVSGAISSTGGAIIANDMHLGLSVPNTWFRASFEYPQNNKNIKVTGATLPGTPNMVVGSNGNIAWGFTNSYGDYNDIILLKMSDDKSQYLTADGYKNFILNKQVIAVKGEDAVEVNIKETIWGPVIGENHLGQLMAYRWVAHDKQAVNLTAIQLEQADTVDQAFNIAARSGIPSQNMMVGDKLGNIGWTIMGPIPSKFGNTGDTPTYWHEGKNGWNGYLTPAQYPKIKNPSDNRLWTANARVVGGVMLDKIGNGGYALGARAGQIRDNLFSQNSFNEKTLLAIGLDDRAVFLQRWKNFLLTTVLNEKAIAKQADLQAVKTLLQADQKLTASIDSVAYRLVRNFRINVRDSVFSEFNKTLKNVYQGYEFRSIQHQIETPLWQLINKQPDNFLMRPKSSWQALFISALNKTTDDMKTITSDENQQQALAAATWGQQNTSTIKHPLSKAVPFIGRWLDMPDNALPGDNYMPRVQGKSFGASERMVVSPGHEETGIFHMPTSQAGHPWSPYYGKGHRDWELGKPSAFLPSKTIYTLTLLSY
ncbi:MAG: penicillin acylase family protein [Colwellia sp.]